MFLTGVIPFRESNIITAKADNGEIYVAVRPMAEELGLEWSTQLQKIKRDGGYVHMNTPLNLAEGGMQEMTCIPHKKITKWLFSINPNKVKPEHKAKLIAFQEETEWAIYEYWTKGEAKRTDFIGSEAYKELQQHLFQLEMDKRELNAQITDNLKTIGAQSLAIDEKSRDLNWDRFYFAQTQNKFLGKLKSYATDMYEMGRELEEMADIGHGHYRAKKKVDAFARKMWSSYSDLRDELELLEMQGA